MIKKYNLAKVGLALALFAGLNLMDLGSIPGGDPFRDGKLRYLFLLAGPLVFVYLRKYLTLGPAAFACVAVWSYALNNFMLHAGYPLLAILAVMGVAVGVVRAGKEFLAKILVFSGSFQAAYAGLQLMGVQLFYVPVNPEHMRLPVGFYGHETVLGPFLVACLCPALWRRQWFWAGLMTVVAVATWSSMTLAALGAVYLVFIWHEVGWRWAGALAAGGGLVLAAALVFVPEAGLLNFNGRWVIWARGWEAFRASPLFGSGVGSWAGEWLPSFASRYSTELRSLPRQLHMDYLDFLVEYGAVGAAPLAGAAGLFLRNFRPTWTHAVCVGLLVNSLANFPLCLAPMAVIFVACWAHSMRSAILRECETG